MAARVDELAKSNKRTRAEISSVTSFLRNELPMQLVLDQEFARTSGGMLLTATSPLALAAATVPGHRQARFASLKVRTLEDDVVPGIYVAVLATAVSASRAGDEIWGCAVTEQGRNAGDAPVHALLAALARGDLADAPLPSIERLDRLAERAANQLDFRHVHEQAKRDSEFVALKEAKLISLEAQYQRRRAAIENRIATTISRGRRERSIELFQSQLRRAEERFARLTGEVSNESQPEIRLEYLTVCVLEINYGEYA